MADMSDDAYRRVVTGLHGADEDHDTIDQLRALVDCQTRTIAVLQHTITLLREPLEKGPAHAQL